MAKKQNTTPDFQRTRGRAEDFAGRQLTSRPKSPSKENKTKEKSHQKAPTNVQEDVKSEPTQETEERTTIQKKEQKVHANKPKEKSVKKEIEEEQLIVLDTTGVRVTTYNHSRLKAMMTATKTNSFNGLISLLIEYAEDNHLEGLEKQIYELTVQSLDEEYERNNWDRQLD